MLDSDERIVQEAVLTEPTSRDSWLITLWKRKWLVIVPAVVSTVVTFVVTSVLPHRYQSETVIMVEPPRVSSDYVRKPRAARASRLALQSIQAKILSRTRLEWMIGEFDLYQADRRRATMEATFKQMREDISLQIAGRDKEASTFVVSFTGTEPQDGQKSDRKNREHVHRRKQPRPGKHQ